MTNGGTLKITADYNENYVSIAISDSGSGSAIEDLSRVTDPFYTTKTYGTGLGLTLVEQIIKQHSGELSILQNNPSGLKIIVRLPWK